MQNKAMITYLQKTNIWTTTIGVSDNPNLQSKQQK